MMVYIHEWRMYYDCDSMRYDSETCEVEFTVSSGRVQIILRNINRYEWVRIRQSVVHGIYYEISKDMDYELRILP